MERFEHAGERSLDNYTRYEQRYNSMVSCSMVIAYYSGCLRESLLSFTQLPQLRC